MLNTELTRDARLRAVGELLVETTPFTDATEIIRRTYAGWSTRAEGTCAFIVGMSGAGKTTVADDFLAHTAEELGADYVAESRSGPNVRWGLTKVTETGFIRPVLKVFVAPRIRLRALLFDLLLALGVRANRSSNFGELMSLVRHHLSAQAVKLIIFDEVHHIVDGHGPSTAYEAADLFKMLLIQSRVQIVCLGLPHSVDILAANGQLARRCRARYEIRPFFCEVDDPESDFMQFCAALDATVPFDEPSGLDRPDTALRLHIAGEGYIGRITHVVQTACELAIDQGLSRLGHEVLGEAFRNIESVDDDENPFFVANPRPETFAVKRAQREEEQAPGKRRRVRKKSVPDFAK